MVYIDITINNTKHIVEAPSSDLSDVQELIAQQFGIPKAMQEIISTHIAPVCNGTRDWEEQKLLFTKGKIFVQLDNQLILSNEARNLSNVHVKHVPNQIQVHVKTVTGKTISIPVAKTSLIADLKQKICDLEGLPVLLQRLIYAGRSLIEEEKTLESYKIEADATLHVVLRLTGGMYHVTSGKDGAYSIPMRNCKVLVNTKIVHVTVPLGTGEKELRAAVAQKLSKEELELAMAE